MKPFRLLVIGLAAALAVLAAAVAVVFSSSFQTWAVRRAVAEKPGWLISVGSISAGLREARFTGLRIEQDGAVLSVPSLEAELPLIAAGRGQSLALARLLARGWTLDLSKYAPQATAPTVEVAAHAFAGMFARLQLPIDVSLDGLNLEGEVVLPLQRGRVKIEISGGGLGSGRTGAFTIVSAAELSSPEVATLSVRATLQATMDTPRTFSQVASKIDALAKGARFPAEVRLKAETAAARSADGENYEVSVVGAGKRLLEIHARFPRGAQNLNGTWKLDLRESELAPFLPGQSMPNFATIGEGTFDTGSTFTAVHVGGRLHGTAGALAKILPELAVIGTTGFAAEFDLTGHGDAVSVRQISATVEANQSVAAIRSLQEFECNWRTGAVNPTNATAELCVFSLRALPLAWANPFFRDVVLSDGELQGEFVASARGGGISVRSTRPIEIIGLAVSAHGKPQARLSGLSTNLALDYAPKGWQADIASLTAGDEGGRVLSLDAKVGRLFGADQPLKAAGKLSAAVGSVFSQPGLSGMVQASGGNAAIEFVASLGDKQALQATYSLSNLVVLDGSKPLPLPALSGSVRADVGPDGAMEFSAPVMIAGSGRVSDFTLAGTIAPEKANVRAVEATVTGSLLVVEDLQAFAALLPAKGKRTAGGAPGAAEVVPPWNGLHGSLGLKLKKVAYSATGEASNVGGVLRIEAGMVRLESIQAGLGETGRANLTGALTYDPGKSEPYGLAAEIAVKEFDSGSLFRMLGGEQGPAIEGKFDLSTTLAVRANEIAELAVGAGGDIRLTSRGGIFRGFPVDVIKVPESSGRIAGIIASAGNAFGGLAGKREFPDIASKAQAVSEFSKGLNPIPYDQLSVVVSRDAALTTTLRDFSLISPELRLTGNGTILHKPGASVNEDSLAMEFKLRVRGRQGELLKYLGALDPKPDAFGYLATTFPLRIGGTIGKPDASDLNGRLSALAFEKAGVTEKAADLFNKVFGR